MLAALARVAYPTPTRVWRTDPPPTLHGTGEPLSEHVLVYGHPTAGTGLVRSPDWHRQARCWSAGTDVFYGDEVHDGRPVLRPKVLARARAICRGCPVSATCLTYALENDERYGVWAGTSGRNRDAMQARLRAGETVAEVVTGWLATL